MCFELFFRRKIKDQRFRPKLSFCDGFRRNRLGQNVSIDRGIIPSFHTNIDFDTSFTRQSRYFPENLDFCSLCLNNLFLFGGQICEAFMFLEYRI